MATKSIDVDVKCPYYLSSSDLRIYCGDDIKCKNKLDNYDIVKLHHSKDLRKEYMSKFCCDNKMCEKCAIYKVMLEKQSELKDF